MADHSVSTISIRDCRIRVMRGGSGSPMLFLHGGGGAGSWLPFMSRLAATFDVIVSEHPGFGGSDTPPWLDTVPDLANFYLDFLEVAGRLGGRRACGAQYQPPRIPDAGRGRWHPCQ